MSEADARKTKPRAVRGPRRDATFNVRLPIRTRELIDSAATLAGKTRTEFVVDSARQQAIDVLLDQRLFSLDEAQHGRFLRALDSPTAPAAKLKALFRHKAPWDTPRR